MDNKQDRQFYWEVKQFMGKTPNLASQENQNSPSLVENIRNVLNKNELYRPSSFNPSINSPNTINQAIGAMEQSKKLGASNSAEHSNNIYGNAFANPPKNLNEAKDDWNWREHSREENIAHGREVAAEDKKKDAARTKLFRETNPELYRKQIEDRAKGEENARKRLETIKAAEAPNKRISPVYWVTHADFERATGHKYDATSAEDRRLFFDLNASGKSNVSPTAGVGQGPAYDSTGWHSRSRPDNVPQFGTPEARYDVVDGQIANTTPQSRAKEAEEVASSESRLKAEKEEVESTRRAREQAKKIVDIDQKIDYFKKMADKKAEDENKEKSARQDYIDQIGDSLRQDGSRTIAEPGREERGYGIDVEHGQFPIYPEGQSDSAYVKPREAPGSAISDVINSLISGVGKSVIEKGKNLGSTMKQSLMQTVPMQGQPAGGANPDIERGQFPIYPEGQSDSTYARPREAPSSAVSDIINNLVKSVGDSATNLGADLQRYIKTNLAQTTPNVIKDKLYGDAAFDGRAQFDTQEKTPSTPAYDTYWGNLPDPNIHDIDLGDVKLQPEISTGGMNQPMDLADFKDEEEEKVPQSSTDFVKDIVKPLKDAGEEQSAQEKINDILKNLGTPSSTKTSKKVKRKRKGTTGLAMVGEGVVVPPPSFDPFFSGKELRTDLIGNPNPVPTFTGIGKGVANTVMNPIDSAKSAANMAKKGVSAVEYAVKNPIPAATTVGKTGLQIGGAIVLPYIAGEGARQIAELGTNLVGLDPATEMHEVPNLSKEIESVADWSAMAGAGQLYMNALRGAPLLSGVGTQLASGAIGGALVPVFAYGGFKAGEALRDVSTPEMLGLEVTDKTGKLRPKTYAETGEDVVNYVIGDSETDKNKEWRSRRGMPNQGKPEPTVYPTVAELQKRTKEEKERKMIESGQLRRDIPSPLKSNTWDHANKSPSGPPVRAPRI